MGDLFARRFKRSILSVDMMINVKEGKRKEKEKRKGKEETEKRRYNVEKIIRVALFCRCQDECVFSIVSISIVSRRNYTTRLLFASERI